MYDLVETERRVETVVKPGAVRAPKAAAAPAAIAQEPQTPSRETSLARGTLFAAGFALGGVLLWLAVAWATGREFGFLAWAVGALAGLGMLRESDDHTPRAGLRAAALAAGAIVLARLVLYPLVVMPSYAGTFASTQTYDDGGDRGRVTLWTTLAALRERGREPSTASDEQWLAARAEASARVGKMSDAEFATALKEASIAAEEARLITALSYEWMKQMSIDPDDATDGQVRAAREAAEKRIAAMDAPARKAALDQARGAPASPCGKRPPGTATLFVKYLLLSPSDWVFLALAAVSALKIATFGTTDEHG